MKKLLLALTLLLSPVLFVGSGFAVDISGGGNAACQVSPETGQRPAFCDDIDAAQTSNPLWGPDGVLTSAINVVSLVGGVIAVIVMIIAGIRMTLSGGDSQKIASVRSTVIYAAVGLVVAGVAQFVVQFVLFEL